MTIKEPNFINYGVGEYVERRFGISDEFCVIYYIPNII